MTTTSRTLALALLALSAFVPPGAADPTLYDVHEPCAALTSGTGPVGGVAVQVADPTVLTEPDDGRVVDIDVLVLLDGITTTRADAIFADVRTAYSEIGLNVVTTYQTTALTKIDAVDLMQEARTLLGGAVPAGYDMVEILTSKDLPGTPDPAGVAYCLGGVHDPRYAFEVSEGADADTIRVGAVIVNTKKGAKVTAHEMGHLFGGQHELANCAEGAAAHVELPSNGLCTLMFYNTELIGLHFSTANARYVRGYALRYAD